MGMFWRINYQFFQHIGSALQICQQSMWLQNPWLICIIGGNAFLLSMGSSEVQRSLLDNISDFHSTYSMKLHPELRFFIFKQWHFLKLKSHVKTTDMCIHSNHKNAQGTFYVPRTVLSTLLIGFMCVFVLYMNSLKPPHNHMR